LGCSKIADPNIPILHLNMWFAIFDMKKKAIEMNFAMIFSIVAGSAILFLAIYFAIGFADTGEKGTNAKIAAKVSILIDPLETNIGETRSTPILFSSKARIYNDRCDKEGSFGKQTIGVASSMFGDKWSEPTYGKPQYNKYIFSNRIEEGKKFYVFVKSLDMPFKVSDIIIFISQDYCFISAPDDLRDELEDLGIEKFQFTDKKSNCSQDSKKVCFSSSSGCDISVYGEYNLKVGYVSKEEKKLNYAGPLLYAAIFSSPEIYDCNVERLKKRLINLCYVYKDEIRILEKNGCNSELSSHLDELINIASNSNLADLQEKAEQMEKINNAAQCRLW
jgi:hypothetical protein